MGAALGQFGLQVANEAIGAGMGMLIGKYNDERQLRQQQKLQALQIQGQKEMTDYQMLRQYNMWEKTNYAAQVEQLKKAGLNPAMIYGMSGGGGTTTGSASGSVTGAQAPTGGGEIQQMTGMGLQNAMSLRLIKAQAEVLESQAEKNKVEATKTAGVDTEQTKANIESIWQGIDNARQAHTLQKLEITMKNIENFEKQASQEDRLDYIEYQTKIALKQLNLVTNEAKISGATIPDRIQQIKAESIGAILKNMLTEAQTSLTNEQIKKIANEILLNWDKLENDKRETDIHRQLMEYGTDINTDMIKSALHSLNSVIHLK